MQKEFREGEYGRYLKLAHKWFQQRFYMGSVVRDHDLCILKKCFIFLEKFKLAEYFLLLEFFVFINFYLLIFSSLYLHKIIWGKIPNLWEHERMSLIRWNFMTLLMSKIKREEEFFTPIITFVFLLYYHLTHSFFTHLITPVMAFTSQLTSFICDKI